MFGDQRSLFSYAGNPAAPPPSLMALFCDGGVHGQRRICGYSSSWISWLAFSEGEKRSSHVSSMEGHLLI